MNSWRDLWRRILPSRTVEPDVDDELRFHVEGKAEELMAEGMSPDEARAEARRRFGNWDEVEAATRRYARQRARREEVRAAAEGWWNETRVALRSVLGHPGFAAAVVLTLALGIGAVTATYTVVDGVLLDPLPYPRSDRLVRIYQQNSPSNRWGLSAADLDGVLERSRAFSSVAAVVPGDAVLRDAERPRWVRAARVTPGFFPTLGVTPAAGRSFRAAEGEPDRAPVAVLTHALAESRFGSADAALGASLVLDGVPHEVVGVLPPGLRELAGHRAEVWPVLQLPEPQRRGPFFLRVYGRLADGFGVESARRDLDRVSREIFPLWADSFQDRTARLTPVALRESIVGDVRTLLLVFMGSVALVLCIGVANVANLTLARVASRRRELAVRSALGAGRGGLARTLLAESAVLAAIGGGAGLLLAGIGVEILAAALPDLPRIRQVGIDGGVVAFTLVVTAAAAAVAGLLPLFAAGTRNPGDALDGGERGTTADRSAGALRSGLVVGQFTLTVPLLAATALLVATLGELQRVDPGFDPSGVSATRISLPASDYPGLPEVWDFWERAVGEVGSRPEIAAAGIAGGLPPDRPAALNNFDLLDRPVEPGGRQPVSPWTPVDAGFFETLELELLEGRTFRAEDDAAAPPVVMVTRTWAERQYPGESAVGREMISGGCTSCPPTTVVGVVEDLSYRGLDGSQDAVFVPFRQWPLRTMHLLVRSRGSATAGLGGVRQAIQALDPGLPLTDATTLEDRLYDATARPRHWGLLLGAFAAAAVGLASVGVFGVLSYAVRRREREIGVRLALGARSGSLVALVVKRGMQRAGLGVLLGLGLALVTNRLLEGLLFGIAPTDPETLAGVSTFLLGVALLACWLPARRATRVDPVKTMTPK